MTVVLPPMRVAKEGLLEAFHDGSGKLCWIDVVRVELGEGEEVGAFAVDHLIVGSVGLDDLGIGEAVRRGS